MYVVNVVRITNVVQVWNVNAALNAEIVWRVVVTAKNVV